MRMRKRRGKIGIRSVKLHLAVNCIALRERALLLCKLEKNLLFLPSFTSPTNEVVTKLLIFSSKKYALHKEVDPKERLKFTWIIVGFSNGFIRVFNHVTILKILCFLISFC
eukprot:TRINITY_DN9186_c0_g1_i1.p1 TRINITY_DN9186_c0_g1~~TRINITY_DN9186_c0_g1_i1.p1  ORF type:complete len:111 (-),score=20.22 TRINITY_DN9186_c0_g1_i1:942-1274(-)